MKKSLLAITATSMMLSGTSWSAAELVEYNPNVPSVPPAVMASPEVGMFGYVNEKFNRMDRQLQDTTDRMDRLERDSDRIKALELRVADLEKKLTSMTIAASSSRADTAKSDAVPAKPAMSAAEQEAAQSAYKKAFDQLMAGKYSEAGKLFKEFVDKYPDAEQISNAYYWLGETQFVGGKFDLSAKYFAQSAKLNGPKAADALLKEAQSLLELNKAKEAKSVLEDLKKRYPDAPTIKQADKLLAGMKSEAKK
jgi:tol-pal system protein YbgF